MDLGVRQIPDLVALALVLWVQRWLGRRWLERVHIRWHPTAKILIAASMVWAAFGIVTGIPTFYHMLPYRSWIEWLRAASLIWGYLSLLLAAFEWITRRLWSSSSFDPGRRRVLDFARTAVVAAPAMAVGHSVLIERHRFRTTEVEVMIKGLPKDLDGLQIVQLTDIHLGPFLGRHELQRAVDMANETGANLALVTGDLITMRRDELESCFEELRRLRADAGVLGCLGNHEIVGGCEDETAERGAAEGIRFLRSERVPLRFGSAILNVAGVDYQPMRKPYLRGAERLVQPGAFNMLLSHNPDVFPVAARQGFDLTVAGHTHGGQVTVEILHQHINVARFFTPYTYGIYERDGRQIWVSRGLGTVGVPARIGAPPEVALIRLCAT
jgi:predicted MPP superfamily phosphohydrolase